MSKSARILVVDDDDHVREALVDELSPTYRVEAVSCGIEAFDAIALHQYDVIISDLKMPDHDGIEVLEFARQHQRDAVRVLLTGYLDERAHRALLSPDAPYKVGKPWHDEIEVVVRRGLEQRELARRLSASVEDALRLSTFDDELATAGTPLELAEVVVRRALMTEGVTACGTVVRTGGIEHPFTGAEVPASGPGWFSDLPLDFDGDLRLRARGTTAAACQLVSYMAHRVQRRCGVLEARVTMADQGGSTPRMNLLMRQATLGALTSALLHDLASLMQTLDAALGEIRDVPEALGQVADAVADASTAGEEAVQLFVQMRKFIREGEVSTRRVPVSRIVQRTVRAAGGYVRERAQLRVGPVPEVDIAVSEALFLQVLINLLRNAANASPPGGVIDLEVRADDREIVFVVTDDGPGVAPEIANYMFEPFATNTKEGTGLGLAIAAYVVQSLAGRICYRRDPRRGACFSVSLPRDH
jgi:signal transduction histidine kinase